MAFVVSRLTVVDRPGERLDMSPEARILLSDGFEIFRLGRVDVTSTAIGFVVVSSCTFAVTVLVTVVLNVSLSSVLFSDLALGGVSTGEES